MTRNPRVDFLRGIAILCVLVLHFALAYGLQDSPLGSLLNKFLLDGISRNGNYGVTMFFVVSGFLITSNSLARWGELRHIDPRAFYGFRFARIMPPLLLVLAIIVLLGSVNVPFFHNDEGSGHGQAYTFAVAVLSILTFWHNLLMQSWDYFNYCLNIYWSLSVEEVFYLALPLTCLLLRRTWLFVLLCLVLVAVGPLYRSMHADDEIYFMYGYLACFDAIALGCLTALLARRFTLAGKEARIARIVAGVALAVVYLRGIAGHEVFGFSLIAVASAVFLFASAGDAAPGWTTGRLSKGVRWMGRHSYELYLFHIIVLAGMRNLYTKAELGYWVRLPWLCLFLVASFLLAALVARYVAEPANAAIRKRFAAWGPRAGSRQLPPNQAGQQ